MFVNWGTNFKWLNSNLSWQNPFHISSIEGWWLNMKNNAVLQFDLKMLSRCLSSPKQSEDMIDHHSYAHNFKSSWETEAWKKIQAWTGFRPMTHGLKFHSCLISFHSRLSFLNCLSCVHNCDNQSYLHIILLSSKLYLYNISYSLVC